MGDQIVFQQQNDVDCFDLVNDMVEESDHNKFNLNATECLLQEALPYEADPPLLFVLGTMALFLVIITAQGTIKRDFAAITLG